MAPAVQQLGDLQHGLGFTDAAWPHQQESTHWAARTAQIGPGGQQMLVQAVDRGFLAFDLFAKIRGQLGNHRQFALRQAV
ncbi:hypothetical protein D3C75_1084810 [compost metagenome]